MELYRFWRKVAVGDGCWEWRGYVQPRCKHGRRTVMPYGQFRLDGRMRKAHTVAYELAHGPVPSGHIVGHECDNPTCVRPSHLRAITQVRNMQDMHARGRHPGAEAFHRTAV